MDIKEFLKKNEKIKFEFGSRSRTNKIVAAVNLHDTIMNLENDVEYRFKKNKFGICIYKKEDK